MKNNYGYFCLDCGKICMIDNKEYYSVTHKLWKKYGVGENMCNILRICYAWTAWKKDSAINLPKKIYSNAD